MQKLLSYLFLTGSSALGALALDDVPDYFVTDRKHFAGPKATGIAPFLRATNPAPFPGVSYIPNSPLETQVPIAGNDHNENIFELFGHLSHYFPNPEGFGVDEHSLPTGAQITWVNMLSRHGARYPTLGSAAFAFADKVKNLTGTFEAKDELKFLNDWIFTLGYEILVPIGKQELFESGTLHYYQYGHLYPNDGNKIIARSTTQDRMVESAEYFLAGFFGLGWTQNATLEVIIEKPGYNNSLAGYFLCPNGNKPAARQGDHASAQWIASYLADATERLDAKIQGFNWTIADSYAAQTLCAYETVALGYSAFCGLFTLDEWKGHEYSIDLAFTGNNMFQSPVGRATGIGYVQEILSRLTHHHLQEPTGQVNITLDNNTVTFPLNQSLNLDFSHDTNIAHILTAFGLTQFASPILPTDHIPPLDERPLIVSHLTPFAARLDIEVISAPSPVCQSRSECTYETNAFGKPKDQPTQYIHFILNQRTIPLGRSFAECGERDDGWCELGTFLDVQKDSLERAEFEYSCFGEYDSVPYGNIKDGVPLKKETEREYRPDEQIEL
ncbi:phosphoglycerate mutase-like protein [Pseudovirgaria hyperparasitica]|uniref:3-phytase n=1 Tax=Pseudovirgaria hyperparasitica TaxID=470096 RepID=A0A6A6WJV5_9PEZI|nr:phosphoglycerate mutase-like protein [Pseudovirgaria hyperparasitica]KAF2761771.1 phosphoglycerate mutase-like protein [Pseudovirgaria hyperparasitica]